MKRALLYGVAIIALLLLAYWLNSLVQPIPDSGALLPIVFA